MRDSRILPWPIGRLGKFADVRARIGWRGLSSSEYTSDGPFLIAGQHIRSGVVSWDKCDHVSDRRYNESWEISLRNGDVILTKDGTIGRVARIDCLPGKATINGTMMLIRCHQELDYRFLSHYLKGNVFQRLVEDRISGSSIPHIFQRDMVKLNLPLPSLIEQRRIAEILDTVDMRIQSTERLIEKIHHVRNGLAADIFPPLQQSREISERPCNPLSLKDTGVWLSGGTPSTTNPEYWNGDLPWISATSLQRFNILDSDRRLTKQGVANGTQVVPAGTVIFVVRGMSLKSEFRVGVTARRVAFGQDCKAVIPARGIDPLFLAHTLKAGERQILQLVDEAGHGTGRLETKLIQQLVINVPTCEEQQRLVGVIGSVDDELARLKDELAKLTLLKQGLMDDLLMGRVRVGASA